MSAGRNLWSRSLLRIGGPAAVLALTAFHPGYSTDAAHEMERISASAVWLPLHLALLPAFALYGASMLAWPTAGGMWWRLRQVGVALSMVFYSAFVGVDGVAGWLIAHAGAHAPAGLQAGLADGVTTLFSAGPVAALALLGAAGWLIASVAVTAECAAEVRLLAPAGLLVVSATTLGFSHDPPIGPAGAALAIAAAVLLEALSAREAGRSQATAQRPQLPQASPTGTGTERAASDPPSRGQIS